jgi:hypothetical protein
MIKDCVRLQALTKLARPTKSFILLDIKYSVRITFTCARTHTFIAMIDMQDEAVELAGVDTGLGQCVMTVQPSPEYLRALVAQADPGAQWVEFGLAPVLEPARCIECINVIEQAWQRAFGKEGLGPVVPMLVAGSTATDFRLELPLDTAIALIGADAYIMLSAHAPDTSMFMLRRYVGTGAHIDWHVNPYTCTTIQIPLLSDIEELGGHLYFADGAGIATRARRRSGHMIYYSGSMVRAETKLAPGTRQYALFMFT